MFAVGRLGSYISRGVSKVSSPFPLGGAVDIIVVEQQDGSFKSTPWYVRFGKFQGNLTERIVIINVNGVDAEFYMDLDHKGEAFFTREVDGVEGESDVYVSSGYEIDLKSENWRTQKSMSCNFDARGNRVSEFDGSPRKSLSRANSRRGRFLGLPIGRRSMKENGVKDAKAEAEAEMAADLLEVRWSTNLRTGQNPNSKASEGQKVDIPSNGRNETQGEVSSSPKCREGEGLLNVVLEKDKNNGVLASDDSKEEQFEFSDIDDSKDEKGTHSKSLSSGSLELPSPSGSSDDGDSKSRSDGVDHPRTNSNRISTPISISKVHSDDADVAAVGHVAESLPNMVFDGGDLSVNATQPYGRSLDSTLEAFKMVGDDNSPISPDSFQISEEIRKIISDPAIELSLCKHSLFEGMGYETASRVFDAEKLEKEKFLSFGPNILENDKLVVRIGGLYFPWDAALPIASAIGSQGHVQNLEPKGMIPVGEFDKGISESDPRSMNSNSGSWRMWPFSSKRTNSMRSGSFNSEIHSPGTKENVGVVDKVISKVLKKKLREKFPTSEQLGSLNLQEGKNIVIFTYTTAMYGEQQVEARIFLWKWNSRIVISDVDGTITKSDVLGQFMPLMGYDWSQTGVTHLFSAIKENGYQLLFLSARSISQAYLTRQFLINLKQDGKALPEGPVLISPDGLFPSLYREVIRRAPHEFKIACLEDVKVLFPVDYHPFYAGFGNRDTDELSYLKVGIPRGKIFTINPKGEVVVNRRVDSKSYTSLHALVHDMFPPTTVHEEEDYNSWNFWRLPPPDPII